MNARKLCAGTQRAHIRSCKRFAAFLKRSPETATFEDIRRFQLYLGETGVSICTRNVVMTGLRFLFRVTLRRLDLAAEIYHLRAPQRILQALLGHDKLETTARYALVATGMIASIASPLDLMREQRKKSKRPQQNRRKPSTEAKSTDQLPA